MSSPTTPHQVLWLVRHGESDWNRSGIVQGHQDMPELTARGRKQAERAAIRLATERVEAVYSSDLRRARSTAATIAGVAGRPVITDPRLRERCFGIAEGSPVGSMGSAVTGLDAGKVADASAHPVGGESLAELHRRCLDFARWIAREAYDGDVVVVAHGGSLRLLICALTCSDLDGMYWGEVPNGSVQRVVLDPQHLDGLDHVGPDRTNIATEGAMP